MAARELNYRETEFASVSLLWDAETDSVEIELRSGEALSRFPVLAEQAHDAFLHPFVYEPLDAATERMLAALEVDVPDESEIPV